MWDLVAKIGMQFLAAYIDKYMRNTEAARRFYAFVDELASSATISAKLREESIRQRKKLKGEE